MLMRMTRWIPRILMTLGALVALAAPAAAFKLEGEPKIAMILFGPKNDGGWSQALDEARGRLEERMGVKIPVVENVPENATAIRPAAELFIGRGYNIIIGSAFGYSDTFKELAATHPAVAFLNPAAPPTAPTSNPSTAGPTRPSISAAWPPPASPRPASSASSAPTPSASSTGPSTPTPWARAR
ncbi:BMP family ABC transporter substrate-binding protein [Methylobrevis pamukkalensis]|uniref:BMP family ABC transporter substrate-binding protein n=1 Tax=Methylobrevis pamukkalensis TaxID=1439726 RepID=UPI002477F1C5|nr:BMP family ABC transporter substrate-binding protein [Methylobrevis pamukkalensis]